MSKHIFIGVSGVAGAGKDLFFQLLSERIECKRFALADELKVETRAHMHSYYDVDIFNCTRKEKDLVRPFLVAHGTIMRKKTKGRHWIDQLMENINREEEGVSCITDIRYCEYECDEVSWLKGELGGVLVHISRLQDPLLSDGVIPTEIPPANSEEERQDPVLKTLADYKITWPTISSKNQNEINQKLGVYVDKFVEWFNAR